MHMVRTVPIRGSDEQAIATVMQAMLRLGWDIQATANAWARAQTGSWWEKKVEVEAVAAGGQVVIDAEPVSSVGVGPAWRMKVQEAIDELAGALGAQPSPAAEAPKSAPFRKTSLDASEFRPSDWREMQNLVEKHDSVPVEAPRQVTLAMQARAGRGDAAEAVGKALWWVVKEVGSAIVAIAVGKSLDGHDGSVRAQRGKLEYQLGSNQMLIRWPDGSASLAPRKYQPGGSNG